MSASVLTILLLLITAGAGLVCYVLGRTLRAMSATVALAASAVAFWLGICVFRAP